MVVGSTVQLLFVLMPVIIRASILHLHLIGIGEYMLLFRTRIVNICLVFALYCIFVSVIFA